MSDAERQRRCRERRARGAALLTIEVELDRLADALVERKLLGAWDAEDKTKVAEAVENALDVWSRHT